MQRGEPLGVQAGAGDEIAAGRKDAILDQYRLNVLRVAHELLCDAMPRRIVVMAHPRMPIIPQFRAAMRSARSASAISPGSTDVAPCPPSRPNTTGALACAEIAPVRCCRCSPRVWL